MAVVEYDGDKESESSSVYPSPRYQHIIIQFLILFYMLLVSYLTLSALVSSSSSIMPNIPFMF